jgi:hypothetical protein
MFVSYQTIRFARRIFLAGAILLLVGSLQAQGVYQNTKNGRTKVWNSAPRPGDAATWQGDRNREGYASGFGTLTWYSANGNIFARYYGNMLDGKLDGPVNAHSQGKVAHATFAEGKRTTAWLPGKAALRGGSSEREGVVPLKRETAAAEKPDAATASVKQTNETIAESPKKNVVPVPKPVEKPPKAIPLSSPIAKKAAPAPPPPESRPSPELFPTPGATPAPRRDADESLQSLVGPPASLHNTHPTESGEKVGPLNRAEVLDLADTIARTHGYDPANYNAPKVEHKESDDTWSLSYDPKAGEAAESDIKPLSITVEGKTKRASIGPLDEHK